MDPKGVGGCEVEPHSEVTDSSDDEDLSDADAEAQEEIAFLRWRLVRRAASPRAGRVQRNIGGGWLLVRDEERSDGGRNVFYRHSLTGEESYWRPDAIAEAYLRRRAMARRR